MPRTGREPQTLGVAWGYFTASGLPRRSTRALRGTRDVLKIVVIFLADVFHQLRACHDPGAAHRRKWLGVSAWIVNGHLDRHVAHVGARVAFRGAQLLGVWMAHVIEPE